MLTWTITSYCMCVRQNEMIRNVDACRETAKEVAGKAVDGDSQQPKVSKLLT